MKSQNNYLKNIWFPFTYADDVRKYPPITISKGEGVYLYDTAGKKYLDAISSWWVNNLGHSNPEIVAAIKAQADKLEHVIMAGFISDSTIMLTQKLKKLLPLELTRIFYSDDGSTAVEAAMKIAMQYWMYRKEKRCEFIALGGAYHGDTLGAMSVGGIPQYHTLFHDCHKKQNFTHGPYCYGCPEKKDKETCSAECMNSLEQILIKRGNRIAACIFEPMVQGAAGMRIYPAKVLTRIFKLCREYGVLTIADEVMTGFGRTGKMFACEYGDVIPDIMCLAKGLTGGYLPLSATVVRETIYQEFSGNAKNGRIFHHGHSFTGNPLAAAAACAVLDILERENIPDSLKDKTTHFQKGLESFSTMENVGEVRSIGMIGALELVADKKTGKRLPAEKRIPFKIAQNAISKGLLVRPLGDVLYFIPPYVIKNEEIDEMFAIAKKAILEEVAS